MNKSDPDNPTKHSANAKKGWETKKKNGYVHTETTKDKQRVAMNTNREGQKAVYDRICRLEARLRGYGFSDEEIRMM